MAPRDRTNGRAADHEDWVLTQANSLGDASRPASWADGALFFGLSALAGMAGGMLALGGADESLLLRHGFLLDFYAVPLALLGGCGRWLLPARLGIGGPVFPGCDRVCWVMLALSVMLMSPVGSFISSHDALYMGVALLLWAAGLFGLALGTVVTVLEERPGRFGDLSLFVWSQLLGAMALVIVCPLIAAEVTHDLARATPSSAIWQHLLTQCRAPMTALALVLSFGTACEALPPLRAGRALPLLLAVMALPGPVLWAHDYLEGAAYPFWSEIVFGALPALTFVAVLCRDMWGKRVELEPFALWAIGALLLGSAGWAFRLFQSGLEDFHSAVLFGAVFAGLGGCYMWMRRVMGLDAPRWFEVGHVLLAALGTVCTLWGSPVLGQFGAELTSLAVLIVMPLVAWVAFSHVRERA
ncbi:heme-copper oxidase family protein [Acidomonas methanolica]|uniref:Cytochrome oxidase subunit I profile domain-containing protein n=1 Tax=Acidomonas methanolica NBRC 104435 TaxID=1231351 RepID=A0A023D3J8_ACIMT|nr:hypothetical protein [Acidomonas methanolica]MBU2653561.1 hypothetical protein [Acidomonas methanolica]TCS31512.1 hypothetical protein EDC31_10261 [Acidomonas methanolica]GAJ28723.1 hypothetical protein Amme_036_011 [Acidomonas methanolica NBRC 104435]GBQ55752.1 hypothetical protein AA0498_2296 [Acidomonas methanolica]GEK97931.1 hypothetical protein AME01nite_04300 [Acidomonas methanolica NBRC 104435]